jgi:uncharacterized membrane protein HdeD (DUF308 family)
MEGHGRVDCRRFSLEKWFAVTYLQLNKSQSVKELGALGLRYREVAMKPNHSFQEALIDVVMLVLGIFLFLSPSLFGYSSLAAAAWSTWISGIVIIILAFSELAAFSEWEEWVNLLAGIWVAVSPWLVGFASYRMAMRVHVLVGVAIAVIAAAHIWLAHREPPRLAA